MSLIAHAMRTLFPKQAIPLRRPAQRAATLSHVIAIACTLAPLAAMIHAMAQTV